jgi:hypothetical protein
MNSDILARAKELQRDYQRKWRREHRESIKRSKERYWIKKAAQSIAEDEKKREGEENA